MSLQIGDSVTVAKAVTQDMLACSAGSGSLRVLATPAVAALMENAACELAQRGLEDIYTTVGTSLSIEHTSPTPLGAEVYATAVLTEISGRMFYFNVFAKDNRGEIARGTHTRVSVKGDSFQKKAEEKLNG